MRLAIAKILEKKDAGQDYSKSLDEEKLDKEIQDDYIVLARKLHKFEARKRSKSDELVFREAKNLLKPLRPEVGLAQVYTMHA